MIKLVLKNLELNNEREFNVDKNVVTVIRKVGDNMQYENEKNSEMEEVLSIINTNRLTCEVVSLEII